MFDTLGDRLHGVFSGLSGRGKLSENDIDLAMREIRRALLEADVSLAVVKQVTGAISERAKGAEVMGSLKPDEQVVTIVNEELTRLMGGTNVGLAMASKPPTIILAAGLQGSGKTTFCAKLARHLQKQGRTPMMVACDVQRPAAADQLEVLGRQIDAPVYRGDGKDPAKIASQGIKEAGKAGKDVVIVDTAGRTSIDEEMMAQLVDIRDAVDPTSVLLVLDSMTGQTAVDVASAFSDAVGFDGVVLTKLDGDARGGAALSVRAVTGAPILFVGTGEKIDALEAFHPDRMASRILGRGDIQSLMEKAQETVQIEDPKNLQKRIKDGNLTLEDFLDQMRQVRKMGPVSQLLGMVPGFKSATRGKDIQVDEDKLGRVEAIIQSMTPHERRRPETINGSRRRRIAAGSGTSVQEVNQLLSQFKQMQKLMKQIGKGAIPAGLADGLAGSQLTPP